MTRGNQWLQNGNYPAAIDRRLFGALWPVVGVSGMAVTVVNGSMNVTMAAGWAAVSTALGGTYFCSNDAADIIALGAAPTSGLSRWDLIVIQPRDQAVDGGGNNDYIPAVIQGAASASPTQPTAASAPAGTVAVATVKVTGGTLVLDGAQLVDLRAALPGLSGPRFPPVAAGSPLVSQTDANGEVWVAKGGVNGGAWRKARDVLHARVSRNAAWNSSTVLSAHQFDTIQFDPYGIWSFGAVGFVVPIAGIYQFSALLSILGGGAPAIAIGSFAAGPAYNNGNDLNGIVRPFAYTTLSCTAGQGIPFYVQTSVSVGGRTGPADCYATCDYLGTG